MIRHLALVCLVALFFGVAGARADTDDYANDPFNPMIARDAWVLIGQAEQSSGIPLGLLHAISLVETGQGIRGWVLPWPYTIGVNSPGNNTFLSAEAARINLNRLKLMGFVRFNVSVDGASRSKVKFADAMQFMQTKAGGHYFRVQAEPYGRRFNNAQEAQSFAQRMIGMGHNNLDIGMMQINWRVHGKHFGSIAQALEPRNNVNYAVRYLMENRAQRDWWGTVGRYHSATPVYAKKYILSVWNMYRRIHRLGNTHQA